MTKSMWVSSLGTASGYGLVAAARRHLGADIRIIGADTNPGHLVAASPLCDEFVQMSPVSSPAFKPELLERLGVYAPDFYVALIEEEVLLAASLRDTGSLGHIVSNAPPHAIAKMCMDKAECHKWLTDHGFPSPVTVLAPDARWAGEPLFAKPRHGFGSVGARLVETESSLRSLGNSGEHIVQECCERPEITLDLFRARAGRAPVTVVCRERIETKAGVCTKARLFRDPELESLGARIASKLEINGAACVQVMHAPSFGGWGVTDVNPRPGSGTPLSAAAGVDFLGAMVLDGLGLEGADNLAQPLSGTDRYVLRHFEEAEIVRR